MTISKIVNFLMLDLDLIGLKKFFTEKDYDNFETETLLFADEIEEKIKAPEIKFGQAIYGTKFVEEKIILELLSFLKDILGKNIEKCEENKNILNWINNFFIQIESKYEDFRKNMKIYDNKKREIIKMFAF